MINKIFQHKYLLPIIQIFTFIIFILLILGAINVSTSEASFAKVLRNTNLSNLIVWSYWWPLIIVSAIFFGRFWCTICPMELVTSLFGRMGLKRRPGKFLRSGWVITIFYAVILVIGIHTFNIHRIPQLMAFYMISLFVIAIAVGLLWEKRTFCTYVCPIGHLLGFYSLLSFKKLRVKEHDVCKICNTKDCIAKKNHYNFVGRSCTSELFPPRIEDNRDCILCGQCFKSCPNNNIAIKKRKFAADLFKNIKLSWAEIVFFIVVSGFVIYEILSEWKVTKSLLMAIPDYINNGLNFSGRITGTVKAFLLFVILPFCFYLIFAILKKAFSKESWKDAFTQLVIIILPIAASMHLLKAILKTTSRIPYWNFSLKDPIGVDSAHLILQNPNLLKNEFLSGIISPSIGIIAIIILLLGSFLTVEVIRKRTHLNRISILISAFAAIIYTGIFLSTLIAWRFI